MAHNLATINGKVAMAYQGETPWHKLGVRMNGEGGRVNVDAALTAANLDWKVSRQDLFLADGRKVDNRSAVVRDVDNAVLGTVSDALGLVQNSDAFGVLTPAIEKFGITIEAAGALGNGARTWMLAKMGEAITPIEGDAINGYFVIVNGHDGTHSYEGVLTPIRVVCQNTLTAAIGDKAGNITNRVFKVPHTRLVNDQTDAIAKLVLSLTAALKETGKTFAALAQRQLTPTEVVSFIESVFPAKLDINGKVESDVIAARRKTVAELVWSQPGAELAGADAHGATAWAAYNAVTYYFDHVRTAEAQSAAAVRKANESALFGGNAEIKLQALRKARQLVDARELVAA